MISNTKLMKMNSSLIWFSLFQSVIPSIFIPHEMTVFCIINFSDKTRFQNYNDHHDNYFMTFLNFFFNFLPVRVLKIYRAHHMNLTLTRGEQMLEIACQYKRVQLVL